MTSRILVVDDEPAVADLLVYNLRKAHYEVLVAADGREALRLARGAAPDLILLDLMLPEVDGLDVCRELRKTSAVPIIMITARDEEIDRVVGLELGADDYVAKPFNPRELVARVKAVLRRYHPGGPEASLVQVGDLRIDAARREVSVAERPVVLRAREFDLLLAFARNPEIVMARDRLLSEVWGYDYLGDSRTIDVHVTWLREKLAGSTARIKTVWGVGYKLVVEEAGEGTKKQGTEPRTKG